MTSPILRCVVPLVLSAAFASSTSAQVIGTDYYIAPVLRAGGMFAAVGAVSNSVIDNSTEEIGVTVTQGGPIYSSDLRTDLGGGNYSLRLSLDSFDNLAPSGLTIGGQATDACGIALGPVVSQLGVAFENEEAALVTSATFTVRNLDGSVQIGPVPVPVSFFPTSDEEGGGWTGGVGVTFDQSDQTAPIGGYDLVVNYRLGEIGEFEPITLPSCGQFGAFMSLEIDQLPIVGRTTTFIADNIPHGSLGNALFLAPSPNAWIDLGVFGAGQGCLFYLEGVFATLPMPAIAGQTAAVPLPIPDDAALAGLVVFTQALSLNQTGAYYISNLAQITVGG